MSTHEVNPGNEVSSGLDSASLPGSGPNLNSDIFGQPLSKAPTALGSYDHPLLKPEENNRNGSAQTDSLTGLPTQRDTNPGVYHDTFESGIAPIDYAANLAGKALDRVDKAIEASTPIVQKAISEATTQISESVHHTIDTVQQNWNAPDNELRITLNSRINQAIGMVRQKIGDLSADPDVKQAITAVTRFGHTVAEKTENFVETAQSAAETWVERVFESTYVDRSSPGTSAKSSSSDSPFMGVIDTGFASQSHGAQVVDAIQQAGQHFPDWLGDGVGTGDWAGTLVQFVDAAQASGRAGAVVNLSFDLTQINPDGSVSTRYELTGEEYAALSYAQDNNVLLVVATGNQGSEMSALGKASQEFDNIIAVGAIEGNQRADYSSYGEGVDFVVSGQGGGDVEGTSLSAARMTGAISQIWKANPDLSYQQVIQALEESATDLQDPGIDQYTGVGKPNFDRAVEIAEGGQVGEGDRSDSQETSITQPHLAFDDDALSSPSERPAFLSTLRDGYDAFKENIAEPLVELLPEPVEEFIRDAGNTVEETVPALISDPGSAPEILQSAVSDLDTAVEGTNYPGYTFEYKPGTMPVCDPNVQKWQERMQERGWRIAVDGMYGAQSAEVARQFQQEKGLTPDGIVGPATWAAAFSTRNEVNPSGDVARGGLPVGVTGAGEESSRVFSYEPGRTLDYNPYVEQWQQRMRDRGWNIEVDGYYGEHSAEVARQFQQEKGLVVDGVVGERTWEEAFRTDNITSSSSGSSVASGLLASYGEPVSSTTPDFLYSQYSGQMTENSDLSDNMRAFLDTISYAEGTYAPDGYRIRFGGDRFDSFADHPRIHEPFRDTTSTAAGRYQFIQGTWDGVRSQLELPDFSPQSQDLAAVQLIKNRGAYEDVEAGRFESAVAKVSKEWASFPGAGYNQPEKNLTDLKQFYEARFQTYQEGVERAVLSDSVDSSIELVSSPTAYQIDSTDGSISEPSIGSPPPGMTFGFVKKNNGENVISIERNDDDFGMITIQRYDSSGPAVDKEFEPNKETVLIVHGFTSGIEEGKSFDALARKVAEKSDEKNSDIQVLTLDWSELAGDNLLDLSTASGNITPVARKAKELLSEKGIDPQRLTLIGHSFGSYVSAMIAQEFGGVKNLVALDPAAGSHYGGWKDIDHENGQEHDALNLPFRDDNLIPKFRDVASNSLSFVVADDFRTGGHDSGDNERAATAHNSFLVNYDFGPFGFFEPDPFLMGHSDVVDVFTNAIEQELLELPNLTLPYHLDNWYGHDGYTVIGYPGGSHEGVITVVPGDSNQNSHKITKWARLVDPYTEETDLDF